MSDVEEVEHILWSTIPKQSYRWWWSERVRQMDSYNQAIWDEKRLGLTQAVCIIAGEVLDDESC